VHTYYNIFAEKVNVPKSRIFKLEDDCRQAKIGCTECKQNLAEILIEYLKDIHTRREEFKKMNVREIIIQSAKKAKEVASETLAKVKVAMDFHFRLENKL
jgi:tryptophanyl-tRNA synthetase